MPPTYREIATAMNYSTTSSIQYMVSRLVEVGCLVRSGTRHARSLRLSDSAQPLMIGPQVRAAVDTCGIDEVARTIVGELDSRELARLSGLLQERVA